VKTSCHHGGRSLVEILLTWKTKAQERGEARAQAYRVQELQWMTKRRKSIRGRPIETVYSRVAYLNQHEGCVVHTQEWESLGIPEALDDEGRL